MSYLSNVPLTLQVNIKILGQQICIHVYNVRTQTCKLKILRAHSQVIMHVAPARPVPQIMPAVLGH